jgi:hypothetical protein
MLFLTSWQRCGKGKAKASTWACSFSSSHWVSSFSRFLYVLAVAGLSCPDVIGEVTYSKRFGFMDAGQDNDTFAKIEGVLRSAASGHIRDQLGDTSPSWSFAEVCVGRD